MFIAYAIPIVQSLYVHMLNTIYMMILYAFTCNNYVHNIHFIFIWNFIKITFIQNNSIFIKKFNLTIFSIPYI